MKTALIVASALAVLGGVAWILYPTGATEPIVKSKSDEVGRQFLENAQAAKNAAPQHPKTPDLFR